MSRGLRRCRVAVGPRRIRRPRTVPPWFVRWIMLVKLIVAAPFLLFACMEGGDSLPPPDASSSDAGSDEQPDARPGDGPTATQIVRTGGVIAISERNSFCLALAACGELDYQECRDAVDDTATVQFAIPGCASEPALVTAMSCMKSGTCGSCSGALTTWASTFASSGCESDVYSIGIGDRTPIGAADSHCDGGIRSAGGWCTRACSTSQQCAGTGVNGKNHFGTENTCGADSLLQGKGCYPTCTSTADCQAWFGETRYGLRIACKQFDDGSATEPICVRVNDSRGVELP